MPTRKGADGRVTCPIKVTPTATALAGKAAIPATQQNIPVNRGRERTAKNRLGIGVTFRVFLFLSS